jgi:predicted acetyltransferase
MGQELTDTALFIKGGYIIMENLYLAAPDVKYKKSFEDYVLAYQKSGNEFYFSIYKKALENFQDYL